MQIGGRDIGVCSWSLKPANTAALVRDVQSLGLSHVQLALGPLLDLEPAACDAEMAVLNTSGITLCAGMISFAGEDYSTISVIRTTGGYVADESWPARRERTFAAIELAKRLGISILTTHIGFVPQSSDESYTTIIDRVRDVAAAAREAGIELLMETGQEAASELLQFLNDLAAANVGVNFDPANMILYGAGDPIEAIEILDRHIRHVHVKDATLSKMPGVHWGTEVPFGTGDVNVAEFLEALDAVEYDGPLVIEREAGEARIADVKFAIETMKKL